MMTLKPDNRAACNGRHNPALQPSNSANATSEAPDRNDAVEVWRVRGADGSRLRFCCRLGQLTVHREPGEKLLASVNLGHLAEIRCRAARRRDNLSRSLEHPRPLTEGEIRGCWIRAAADPEARLFASVRGGSSRFGDRRRLMISLANLLRAHDRPVPWDDAMLLEEI